MIPFGNENVTLVQRAENVVDGKTRVTYSKATLTGCSWRRRVAFPGNEGGGRMPPVLPMGELAIIHKTRS